MYIAFVVFTSVIVGLLTEKTIHIVWKIYILWKGRDSTSRSTIIFDSKSYIFNVIIQRYLTA